MLACAWPSGPAWDLAGFQGPPVFQHSRFRRPPGCWLALGRTTRRPTQSRPRGHRLSPPHLAGTGFLLRPRWPLRALREPRPPSGERRQAFPPPPHSSQVEGQATQGVGCRGAGRGPGKAPFQEQGRGSGASSLAGPRGRGGRPRGRCASAGARPPAPRASSWLTSVYCLCVTPFPRRVSFITGWQTRWPPRAVSLLKTQKGREGRSRDSGLPAPRPPPHAPPRLRPVSRRGPAGASKR